MTEVRRESVRTEEQGGGEWGEEDAERGESEGRAGEHDGCVSSESR